MKWVTNFKFNKFWNINNPKKIKESKLPMHTVSSQNFGSLSFSGNKVIKKSIIKTMLEKKLSKDNSLEVNVTISRKNLSLTKKKTYFQLGRMTKVWSQFQWYQFPIHYSRPDLNKLKFSRSAPVWTVPKLQIRRIKVISKLKFWLVDIDDPLWICQFKTLYFFVLHYLKELFCHENKFFDCSF